VHDATWFKLIANRSSGTLLNKVAAGWRKVGRMLDGASQGDKTALRDISSPIVRAHLTQHFPFQQTTVIDLCSNI
jgi:hypothetical protein